MNDKGRKNRSRKGLTLLELAIAVAMVTIIFAAILPQFAAIRNSWDSKQGIAEAIQNGRVLMDHINRNLSKAAMITTVSDSSQTNGYIEFEDGDGDVNRYDIHSANNYVEFGPQPGTLSDLAGPVSLLRFTCYSACDLNTPITDPNIRVVKVDATFTNSGALGQDKTFTTWAYLHGNGNNQVGLVNKTPFEFDTTDGRYPALSQIDSAHYLGAYYRSGAGDAIVLAVNPSTWAITAPAGRFQFDTIGTFPDLAQVDSTHYLCAYSRSSLGNAIVLAVNTGTWAVSAPAVRFVFDATSGQYPALAQIDSTHYLCAYNRSNLGNAIVLAVNTGTWAVSAPALRFQFDGTNGTYPDLAQIDSTHYLCAYDRSGGGNAIVLAVNTGTWAVSAPASTFQFDASGTYPALVQIDSTHYLCAYAGSGSDGWAVVLTVNTGTWAVNKGTAFEFDTSNGQYPALSQIDTGRYLCAYTGPNADGWAVVLNVNTSAWTISKETPYEFDTADGTYPALVKVHNGSCSDDWRHLCAYIGTGNDGWSVVLNYTGIKP